MDKVAMFIGYALVILFAIFGFIQSIKLFIDRLKKDDNNFKSANLVNSNNQNDKKVVAAIMAAINCYYDEQAKATNTPAVGFVVHSIKKRI